MEKELLFDVEYFTPTGKPGRKQVRQSRLAKVFMELREKGYYNIKTYIAN